jgi:hypothetical protein
LKRAKKVTISYPEEILQEHCKVTFVDSGHVVISSGESPKPKFNLYIDAHLDVKNGELIRITVEKLNPFPVLQLSGVMAKGRI